MFNFIKFLFLIVYIVGCPLRGMEGFSASSSVTGVKKGFDRTYLPEGIKVFTHDGAATITEKVLEVSDFLKKRRITDRARLYVPGLRGFLQVIKIPELSLVNEKRIANLNKFIEIYNRNSMQEVEPIHYSSDQKRELYETMTLLKFNEDCELLKKLKEELFKKSKTILSLTDDSIKISKYFKSLSKMIFDIKDFDSQEKNVILCQDHIFFSKFSGIEFKNLINNLELFLRNPSVIENWSYKETLETYATASGLGFDENWPLWRPLVIRLFQEEPEEWENVIEGLQKDYKVKACINESNKNKSKKITIENNENLFIANARMLEHCIKKNKLKNFDKVEKTISLIKNINLKIVDISSLLEIFKNESSKIILDLEGNGNIKEVKFNKKIDNKQLFIDLRKNGSLDFLSIRPAGQQDTTIVVDKETLKNIDQSVIDSWTQLSAEEKIDASFKPCFIKIITD